MERQLSGGQKAIAGEDGCVLKGKAGSRKVRRTFQRSVRHSPIPSDQRFWSKTPFLKFPRAESWPEVSLEFCDCPSSAPAAGLAAKYLEGARVQ